MKSLRIFASLSLASAYVHPTTFLRRFGILPHLRSPVQESVGKHNAVSSSDLFEQLCKEVGIQPAGLLRLDDPEDGIRGLYLNHAVKSGDIVLSVPLSKCLREDQELPDWMPQFDDDEINHDSTWALRLAACLTEAQTSPQQSHHALWFSLLPNPTLLKASLPVHWDDDIVQSTNHTAFAMAVDSAYFARASALQLVDMDLSAAMDVVQTRACLVETSRGDPLRLLAPVFDFVNHASPSTAEFDLENDDALVVRAVVDLQKDQQVCIDYGPSTKPAWKSLVSYGFIPTEDEDFAEVYLDGVRYEVGPDIIPVDMIIAASSVHSSRPVVDDAQDALSPEIATFLARRIADASFHYLRYPEIVENEVTLESIISKRLVSSLRWNQHQILWKCSLNLQDWANRQSAVE